MPWPAVAGGGPGRAHAAEQVPLSPFSGRFASVTGHAEGHAILERVRTAFGPWDDVVSVETGPRAALHAAAVTLDHGKRQLTPCRRDVRVGPRSPGRADAAARRLREPPAVEARPHHQTHPSNSA